VVIIALYIKTKSKTDVQKFLKKKTKKFIFTLSGMVNNPFFLDYLDFIGQYLTQWNPILWNLLNN